MNLVVVDAMVPFAPPSDDDEVAADLLVRLRDAGHRADPVRIPFRWEGDQLAQLEGVRLLGLGWIDAVVALRFPALAITHPRRLVWRTADLDPRATPPLVAAERVLLREAERVVTAPGAAGVQEILEVLGA